MGYNVIFLVLLKSLHCYTLFYVTAGMRQSAETENLMTSVERALEYANLKPEAAVESKPGKLCNVVTKSFLQ